MSCPCLHELSVTLAPRLVLPTDTIAFFWPNRVGRSDGLHGFIPSYQKVVEDQIYFVDKIVRPAAAANVSVFAYGISLGG